MAFTEPKLVDWIPQATPTESNESSSVKVNRHAEALRGKAINYKALKAMLTAVSRQHAETQASRS